MQAAPLSQASCNALGRLAPRLGPCAVIGITAVVFLFVLLLRATVKRVASFLAVV
jgi:hypothetical protein